ncbi:hypothetical protein CL622_01845, partial [archaeon]|nr:hypothetical protein [archaeon]
DLSGYELRYETQTTSAVWDNANVLTSVTKGTLVTNAALPPGSWTLHDRAVDTSSNYSSNSALFNLTVTNQNNVITTVTNAPSWLGINPTYAAYPKYIGHMPNSISVTNDVDGTYFDNLGLLNTNTINTVRFDHVPASKAALGFKVEAAETNLLLRSETFDNVKWVKTGSMVVTADQAVAPNGTTTADKLDDTSAGQDQVYNNVTISDDNSVLKYSVFMHKGTSSNVSMNLSLTGGSGSDNVAIFDLENGVALPTTGGAAPDDAGIVAIGNGWFRCWVEKANNGSGNTTARCYIHPAHSATFEEARDNSYTGDCYAWGATLESNLDISSYVKTEGSTVLRDADDIIDNEVSAWWKDDGVGNTIVVDTHLPFVGSLQTVFQIDTASTNNLLSVYFDDGIPTLTIVDSGTIQVSACAVGSAWVDGQSGSFALRVKRNNITFYQDGVSIVSSTTGTIPVFSGGTLRYGNDLSGNYLNGHIAMFEQWAHPQKELDLKFRSRGERVNGRSVGALVRHDLSQSLLPNGTGVGADVTSTYSVDPLPSAVSSTLEYFTPEQTFSFDATNVRVWGDLEGKLMPGASGSAVVDLEIDYRTDAGSYDGFEAWTVGNVTARNILAKPILDTTQGKSRLTKSTLTLDVLDREESAKDIVVSSGGSTILFSEQFHYAPIIQLTVDATSGLFPVKSTVTTSGFTAQVFNTSNQDVGGIIDWQATGA